MTKEFESKTAIVTGAGSGIGAESARRLGAKGARVVVADVNEAAARELAAQIEKGGGTSVFVDQDVSDADSVRPSVEFAVRRFGGLDLAVNDAGIGGDQALRFPPSPAAFAVHRKFRPRGRVACLGRGAGGRMLRTLILTTAAIALVSAPASAHQRKYRYHYDNDRVAAAVVGSIVGQALAGRSGHGYYGYDGYDGYSAYGYYPHGYSPYAYSGYPYGSYGYRTYRTYYYAPYGYGDYRYSRGYYDYYPRAYGKRYEHHGKRYEHSRRWRAR